MSLRKPRAVTALAVLAAVVATVAVYPRLPSEMATHWNAAGEVDDTVPRLWGAFLAPALMVVLTAVLYVVPRIDPRRENIEAFRPTYEWFVAGLVVFLAYVHGLVLLWNLGTRVPVGRALAPPLAGLLLGVGFLLERARPNWFVGVRTPWTLSDDEVWDRTHEQAAFAFKLAGVMALGGAVWPRHFLAFVVGPTLVAAAYSVGYSLVTYHRESETADAEGD